MIDGHDTTGLVSEGNSIMSSFANAELLDASKKTVCGVFFSENTKYNFQLVTLLDQFVKCYLDMLKLKGDPARAEDAETKNHRQKQYEDLLQQVKRLSALAISFFEGKISEREKIKMETKHSFVENKNRVMNNVTFDKGEPIKGKTPKIYYLGFAEDNQKTEHSDHVIAFYYYNQDISGLIRAKESNSTLNIKRAVTILFLKEIVEYIEDSEVKEFFKSIIELEESLGPDYNSKGYSRLFDLLVKIDVDVYFGYEEDSSQSNDEEGPQITVFKPMLIRIGYFSTKKLYKEVISDLTREFVDEEEDTEIGEKLIGEKYAEMLRKMYRLSETEDEQRTKSFLNRVRRSVIVAIKQAIRNKKVKQIVFRETTVSGNFEILQHKIEGPEHEIIVMYEEDVGSETIKNFFNRITRLKKERTEKSYMNLKGMVKSGFSVRLQHFLPYWDEIKNSTRFDNDAGIKAIVSILQFGAVLEAVRIYGEQKGITELLFVALNTKNVYPVWDAMRVLGDVVSRPFQTITMRSFGGITGSGDSYLKNTYLSALRGSRKDTIVIKHPGQFKDYTAKVTLVIEHSSVTLKPITDTNGNMVPPHYLYKVYDVAFKPQSDTEMAITIKEKTSYTIFADEKHGDIKEIDNMLFNEKQKGKIVLISQHLHSYGAKIFQKIDSENKHFVLYKTITTPTLSLSAVKKDTVKDAYVIFEKDIIRALKYLGIERDEKIRDYALVAIKAPSFKGNENNKNSFSRADEIEQLMNSSISLFFAGNMKGERSQEIDVMTLVFLSWLIYENESFQYTHARPKFMPKKLPWVRFNRKPASGSSFQKQVNVPLSAAIIELAYLLHKFETHSLIFSEQEKQ